MDDKERYERGMAMRRKTLGATHVDRANAKEGGEVLAEVEKK